MEENKMISDRPIIPEKVILMFDKEDPEMNNFTFLKIDRRIWRRDNKTGEITNHCPAKIHVLPYGVNSILKNK